MKLLPVLALLPLLTFSAIPASAQTIGSQCTTISADAERLACFDAAFAAPAIPAGGAQVVLQSEQLIPARPSGREKATITVACEEGELSVAFGFAGNLMSALGRDVGITTQSNLQAARSRTLLVNADNTAVMISNTRDAVAFLDGLAGTTNLTVRVTPVTSRSLSVRYKVSDIAEQVAPVRAACGV